MIRFKSKMGKIKTEKLKPSRLSLETLAIFRTFKRPFGEGFRPSVAFRVTNEMIESIYWPFGDRFICQREMRLRFPSRACINHSRSAIASALRDGRTLAPSLTTNKHCK